MSNSKPDIEEKTGIVLFRCRWLTRQFVLCVLMAFAVLLCAFLNRLHWATPWDDWSMAGVQAVFWRKPIAVGFLSAAVCGVLLTVGCLLWWLVFRAFGMQWGGSLQGVWANWANAGMGAWIVLLSTTAILQGALFPIEKSKMFAEADTWFEPQSLTGRQGCYLLVACVLAMIARNFQLGGGKAQRTPPGQWVRVVGGWTEFQFAERRMPTLDEINQVAPDTPVFVLNLYCRAMLNKAALRACGYTRDTPNPPAAEIQKDSQGNPTGLLIARPNANILYSTLAKGPKLPPEYQMNSTRHFMRELNRLGLTSVIDAGGGFQNYPEDYAVIDELHKKGEMTLRIAYNLFTQKPKQEKEDFARWVKMTEPGIGDDYYRCNGAGEMLVFSAADFEDFLEPRPELPDVMESELKEIVGILAANKWPFRLHATYDESITRFLDVYEEVNREIPFEGLHWFFDHCETISERNLERVKALGGGIAVQCRMAFQGEYFMERYGREAAEQTPPVRKMLEMGIPVGAGTDATRVASYNPWVSLYWLSTGKTVGGG